MKKKFHCVYMILCASFLLIAHHGYAENFSACIAQMPLGAENDDKGILVDLVHRWAIVTGNQVSIKTYPFKRSIINLTNEGCDFHLPLIENPYTNISNTNYEYSTSVIVKINFVLYTNKDYPIDPNFLYRYSIATDAAHTHFFDFPVKGDYKIEGSLKKLSTRRIDGYIYADIITDKVLLELGLKNIKRQFYKSFNVRAILPKGKKGGPADSMITKAMEIIKADGSFDRIMTHVNLQYSDWQP